MNKSIDILLFSIIMDANCSNVAVVEPNGV